MCVTCSVSWITDDVEMARSTSELLRPLSSKIVLCATTEDWKTRKSEDCESITVELEK